MLIIFRNYYRRRPDCQRSNCSLYGICFRYLPSGLLTGGRGQRRLPTQLPGGSRADRARAAVRDRTRAPRRDSRRRPAGSRSRRRRRNRPIASCGLGVVDRRQAVPDDVADRRREFAAGVRLPVGQDGEEVERRAAPEPGAAAERLRAPLAADDVQQVVLVAERRIALGAARYSARNRAYRSRVAAAGSRPPRPWPGG